MISICFHGIGDPERQLEPGESRYWVTRDAFLRVLDELALVPEARISFDDGNASDVEIGLPALLERGLTATFFVLAGRLDRRGSLSSEQVRLLADHGMGIGSHGMHHRPWRGLSPSDQHAELVLARRQLAEVCGRPVDEAALPLGRYDRRLLAQLRRLGYRRVHTSDRARAREGAWLQPRFSVTSSDTVESVRATMLTPPALARRAERRMATLIKGLR